MARLFHLVRYLPADGALSTELAHGWSTGHELAALGVEVAHEHYRAYLAAHGVRKSRLPAPLRIPRPHRAEPVRPPRRRRGITIGELAAAVRAGASLPVIRR